MKYSLCLKHILPVLLHLNKNQKEHIDLQDFNMFFFWARFYKPASQRQKKKVDEIATGPRPS